MNFFSKMYQFKDDVKRNSKKNYPLKYMLTFGLFSDSIKLATEIMSLTIFRMKISESETIFIVGQINLETWGVKQ